MTKTTILKRTLSGPVLNEVWRDERFGVGGGGGGGERGVVKRTDVSQNDCTE